MTFFIKIIMMKIIIIIIIIIITFLDVIKLLWLFETPVPNSKIFNFYLCYFPTITIHFEIFSLFIRIDLCMYI